MFAAAAPSPRSIIPYRAVARGSYGCTVKDPVPRCINPQPWEQKDPERNKIAKLYFQPRIQQREWNLMQLVRDKVDPRSEFTPRLYGECAIPMEQAELYSGCGKSNRPGPFQTIAGVPNVVHQIVMEDVGQSWEMLHKPIPFSIFMNMCIQAAAHLHKLNDSGLLHNDVALRNLMYNTVTKKVTLIDFSLLSTVNDLWGRWDSKLQHNSPPEWVVWNLFYHEANAVTNIKEDVRVLSDILGPERWQSVRARAISLMTTHYKHSVNYMRTYVYTETEVTDYVDRFGTVNGVNTWRGNMAEEAASYDLYSLGVVMANSLHTPGQVTAAHSDPNEFVLDMMLQMLVDHIAIISPSQRATWTELERWFQGAYHMLAGDVTSFAYSFSGGDEILELPLELRRPIRAIAPPERIRRRSLIAPPPAQRKPIHSRSPVRPIRSALRSRSRGRAAEYRHFI